VKTRSAIVVSAAAALFIAGTAGAAHAEEGGAAPGKVKCVGVNSCKGHSDCKSAGNSCQGKNSCAGKGFMMMSQAECDAAKAAKAQEKK
jgi:uncharacterized membrane protein